MSGRLTTSLDYRLVFHKTPGLVLVLERDFTMIEATDARLAATGTTRSETLGRNIFEIFPDNPADIEATGVRNLRASLERVLATKEPDSMAVQKYDVRRSSAEGGQFEERYWSPLNVPVLGPDGDVLYIIHRVEDVTEFVRLKRQRREQAQVTAALQARNEVMEAEIFRRAQEIQAANEILRQSNESMRALDRAKTAFFNNASHELRTPLMLVLGPLEEAVANAGTLPGELGSRLAIAHRNAQRMHKLVNGLLDFASIEAGRLQPRPQATEIVALTKELVESFQFPIERAGLGLRVECEEIPIQLIDPTIWEKVVLNLLSNALKFTRDGEITLRLQQTKGALELTVADTGIGIPETELPRIFDRFYQVPGRAGRSAEGTGIGLALVKELVELQGGEISVQSRMPGGSSFTVTLPLRPVDDAVTATPTEVRDVTLRASYAAESATWNGVGKPASKRDVLGADRPAHPANGRPSVLVVDDNADMREHLTHVLSLRFAVVTAEDASAAWTALEDQPVDLVLTDVMLPQVDGLEFLRQLRAHEKWRTLPMIVLTARAEESASIAGLESGADDYLMKPFSAAELVARVDTHIKLTRLRNEAAVRERSLREEAEFHRARLEAVMAGVTDGFALLDPNFRLLYLNEREAELIGRPKAELVNTVVWDALPAYTRGEAEPHLRRAVDERQLTVFEYHDRERDRWFEKRAYPVDEGVALFSVDVSERRIEERLAAAKYNITRKLAESPRLAAAAAEVLKELCYSVDAEVGCFWQKSADGELLELAYVYPDRDTRPEYTAFFAASKSRKHPPGGSLPGRVWIAKRVTWIPVLADDAEFSRAPTAQAAGLVAGIGVPVSIDHDLVGVIELFVSRRIAPNENYIRMLGAAGSEISQFIHRRRAEAEQNRLSAIVQHSNEAIVSIGLDNVVTSWNHGAERLYGYPAEEVIGCEMSRVVPAERLHELNDARQRVFRGERVEAFETVRLRKNGERIEVLLSLSPMFDDAGQVIGLSAITRDITESKRNERIEQQNRELQEENRRAINASRLKSDFLANMSHELRTPLHGIIGFSEFLVDEKVGPLNATQKEFLTDVLTSAGHLLRLINNVLDLSKVEAGQLELFPECFVVGELVREVCTIVRPLAEQNEVTVKCPGTTGDFEACADPLRLRQVLYNLLSNAVQYNVPGGSVAVEALRDDNEFELSVSDTGLGIAPEHHAQIFQEFRQLRTPGRGKGTGLGLAVTKRLVEQMAGSIRLESEVGRGSRFTIRLPVTAEEKKVSS